MNTKLTIKMDSAIQNYGMQKDYFHHWPIKMTFSFSHSRFFGSFECILKIRYHEIFRNHPSPIRFHAFSR